MLELVKMFLAGFFFSVIIILFITILHKSNLHQGKGKALIFVCLIFLAISINHMINPALDLLQAPRAFTGKLTVIKEDFDKAIIYIVQETENELKSIALYSYRKNFSEHIQSGGTIKVLFYPNSKLLAGIVSQTEPVIARGEAQETTTMYFNWSL